MTLFEDHTIFTLDEAADVLKVTPGTLRLWITDRKIGAFRAGREWRVTGRDLNEYIERERQPAREQDETK